MLRLIEELLIIALAIHNEHTLPLMQVYTPISSSACFKTIGTVFSCT